ncbi:phosphate acetyltransferase [Petrimonas sulfuriphila]|jgi:phosphate acetyltransferase|uniref:phosphate acetyltransferase n=1 Tax=Petrimonas TaxID=307628 RepID=UPI000E84695A|nr:phosphate acetyltransferase [Petrimonas sp.]BBD46675.1 phosphate acetyltransferase [Petrimonas sp. IBARAKI]HBK93884.1 phosphate acetyltransferase [Porphyromonadaceae bacterium]MEA4997733.1 phosphate acetyltransferase [Petrimonas sp.]MEA5070440.1 phosphate acetyltransferase [Petrimonas sp.]
MNLINEIIERAKADKQRIVLPEGTETRTLQAADQLVRDGVAEIILLGNPQEINLLANQLELKNIGKTLVIDPKNHDKKQTYIDLLVKLRQAKGMTPEKAAVLVEDPLYLACLMIKNGDADGEIAGAQNTTGDVLRPALQIIKTSPGVSVVSGAFIMFTKTTQYGKDGILIFADCAVMPNPTAQELASIAIASAQTARGIVGVEPRVAMLSFSTKGSAQHEMIDKVAEATRIAKEIAPDLLIDGELQADAALVPSVGASKAPGSAIAGQANVLVFPTLEAGNIGYKLVQRLGNAEAVGPILQGMAAPVNDLSRGCSVDDIYKMVAIAANQSIAAKSKK